MGARNVTLAGKTMWLITLELQKNGIISVTGRNNLAGEHIFSLVWRISSSGKEKGKLSKRGNHEKHLRQNTKDKCRSNTRKHGRERMWELVTLFACSHWQTEVWQWSFSAQAILCVFLQFSHGWLFDSALTSSMWNGFISPQTSFKAQVTSFHRPRQNLQAKAKELWKTDLWNIFSSSITLSLPVLGLYVLHITIKMLQAKRGAAALWILNYAWEILATDPEVLPKDIISLQLHRRSGNHWWAPDYTFFLVFVHP